MGVYGTEPNLHVRGVWVWRSQMETTPELEQHPSYEFYKKRKLDPTNEADRALVTAYWTQLVCDESKLEGETLRNFNCIK